MRKLCRSKRNQMLCGVCGGIAEYLNIDATIVRLVWALFAILGGTGILFYIIAAVIMPREEY